MAMEEFDLITRKAIVLTTRWVLAAALTIGLAASIGGCATAPQAADGIQVVASTNVYGNIAKSIAGDRAKVVSIISKDSQDPHSFEADAKVRLELSKAALVIENGAGYDDFIEQLLGSESESSQKKITAADFAVARGETIGPDFNEHLWYDFEIVGDLADSIRDSLVELDPAGKDVYQHNAAEFLEGIADLKSRVAQFSAAHSGVSVVTTEPVSGRLIAAMGFTDLTPPAVGEDMEEGLGVPVREMSLLLGYLSSGQVAGIVVNPQTFGPEANLLVQQADRSGVAKVYVSEIMPTDQSSYLDWVGQVVTGLEALAVQ